MKKIVSLIMFIALFVSLLPNIMSCSDESDFDFDEKMDQWVSLLNYDGMSESEIDAAQFGINSESYEEKVKKIVEELNFKYSKAWDDSHGYPYIKELKEYVKTCDLNRLMVAAHNSYVYYIQDWSGGLYPTIYSYIYNAVYEVHPDLFLKPDFNNAEAIGYYTTNPTACPGVTREEPYNEIYTDSYVVHHYGDFAVEESITWYYDEGLYEWINGVFYDVPGHYATKKEVALYYKGNYVMMLPENWKNYYDNVYIFETDKYIYKFEKDYSEFIDNGFITKK